MIAEMIIWGFFSACGWLTANWIKEEIWPETPAVEQKAKDEYKSGSDTPRRAGESTSDRNHSSSESSRPADLPGSKN